MAGGSLLGLAVALAAFSSLVYFPQQYAAVGLSIHGGGSIPISNQGTSSIASMTLQMPPDFARSITVPTPQSGWSISQSGGNLTLMGGNLTPGEVLLLNFGFLKFYPPSTVNMTATEYFAQGGSIQLKTGVVVSATFNTQVVNLASELGLPAAAGSGVLFLVSALHNIPAPQRKPQTKNIKPYSKIDVEVKAELERS